MSLSPPSRLPRGLLFFDDSDQLVLAPFPDDPRSLHRIEHPSAIDQIVPKTTLKPFSIAQLQHPPPPLIILMEITLIIDPALLRVVKITVVVGSLQLNRFLIVQYALSL
jgi:hypothetical protein